MQIEMILKGIRAKTLIAGVVPPVCAFFLYKKASNDMPYLYLVLCLLLATFIQMATNFYNDAIDYLKGADAIRVGPERITTQDNINYKKVFFIGHICIGIAFLIGIPLVMKGGVVFLGLGVVSLFLAYGYTGGPFPLAYKGLGEVFVFLFFGLLATSGSYYLYSGSLSVDSIVLGAQIGLLSSVLIAINNYRDRHTDILVGKRTLATRLSKLNYLFLLDLFLFVPYLLLLYFVFQVDLKFFFPIFGIPLAYKIREGVRKNVDLSELNEYLSLGGKHLTIFGILFCLACL